MSPTSYQAALPRSLEFPSVVHSLIRVNDLVDLKCFQFQYPYTSPMQRVDTAQEVQKLLSQSEFLKAFEISEQWTRKQPTVLGAWLGLTRAALGRGMIGAADIAATHAVRLAPTDPQTIFFRAIIDHRLGQSDLAIERLQALAKSNNPYAIDAALYLAEVLHRTARHDELQSLINAGGAWLADERAILYRGRAMSRVDNNAAIEILQNYARSSALPMARRIAGFDAVRWLDGAGRYKEAFDLATHLHTTTTPPFDVDGLEREVANQARLLQGGRSWCAPRAPALSTISLVVSLPRSGTTLLEQMLDRHSQVTGIGEYDGIPIMGDVLRANGSWIDQLQSMFPQQAAALQAQYLDGARLRLRPGTTHSFDKMLLIWLWLPMVAAILPGANCLHMARDPRDTAVSMFLSNFHPRSMGWTRSLDEIRRVIAAERSLLPQALTTLEIPHETIVYENLVANPEATLQRCLARMGLQMEPAVLAPQDNRRTVHTLSHEQVRKPINANSIGRWRNYEWAFEETWNPLVHLHDQRRANQP